LARDEETPVTVGITVSITRFLPPPRDVAAARPGRVSVAAFPAASVIAPPLRANDVVAW